MFFDGALRTARQLAAGEQFPYRLERLAKARLGSV